jgi:hypothetical protein
MFNPGSRPKFSEILEILGRIERGYVKRRREWPTRMFFFVLPFLSVLSLVSLLSLLSLLVPLIPSHLPSPVSWLLFSLHSLPPSPLPYPFP